MEIKVDSVAWFPRESVDLVEVKHQLTVNYFKLGEREAIHVPAYGLTRDFITVPRDYGLHLIAKLGYTANFCLSGGRSVRFPREVEHTGEYAYQDDVVNQMLAIADEKYDFIMEAATGKGKCLAKGTKVLMYSGAIKAVEHVKVGDTLMGPDSTPRTVLSTTNGSEEMFKVTPTKGDSYTVNRSHILSLKITGLGGKRIKAGDGQYYATGDIVDISIDDYLQSSTTFKHVAKGWRTGVVFPEKTYLPIPPYILGTWLGDGSSRGPKIHTNDVEVRNAWQEYADSLGLYLNDEPGATVGTYRLSTGDRAVGNVVTSHLRELNLLQNKHVPDEYLVSSQSERLDILAGLVDTDGSLSCNGFDLIFVSEKLAQGVVFLARSLGLAAYVSPCAKECVNTGAWGTYYRVNISGNTEIVPCRIAHKKAKERLQKKDVLVTGISVCSVGEGEYFGFTLSGDRRFLLWDFTVTHNTVMALSVAQKLGRSTIVVVDQENLMLQWVEQAKAVLGLTDKQIGIIQGDRCDYKGKAITVAMVHSLVQRTDYPADMPAYFGTAIFDEVHGLGAPTFSKALRMFPAVTRFGVSATVDRADALQRLLHWNLGNVEVELTDTHDASYLYYLESDTVYSWYANISPKSGRILAEVSDDTKRNCMLAEAIKWMYDEGREVLIVSDRIEQLEALIAMVAYLGAPLEDMGLYTGMRNVWGYQKEATPKRRPHGYVRGLPYTPVILAPKRKKISKADLLKAKEGARLIFATYGMFSKGVDVPRLNGGIDCTPRAKAAQTHGRILRKKAGKLVPIWVTVRDTCSYRLEYQFLKRIEDYVQDSAEIYKWRMDKGVRLVDVPRLKRELRDTVKELKAMEIITTADGSNMLRIPGTLTGLSKPRVTPTVRSTRYR